MPRARSIDYYGSNYFDLVTRVGLEGQELSMHCGTEATARTRQGQYYAFTASLRKSLEEIHQGKSTLTPDMQALVKKITPFAHKVQAWVHSHPRDRANYPGGPLPKCWVTFRPREKSDDNQDLARMLCANPAEGLPEAPDAESTAIDAAAEASLVRLQAKLAVPVLTAKAIDGGAESGGVAGVESRVAAYYGRGATIDPNRIHSTTPAPESNGGVPMRAPETTAQPQGGIDAANPTLGIDAASLPLEK